MAVSERRRQQNREAQRTYRKGLLKRIEDLENRQIASTTAPSGAEESLASSTTNHSKAQQERQHLSPAADDTFSFHCSPISMALCQESMIEPSLIARGGLAYSLSGYPGFDNDENSSNTGNQIRADSTLSCWLEDQETAGSTLRTQKFTGGVGGTVLHAAIIQGNEPIVKLLLEKGGDLSAQTQQRKDTLHLAVESEQMNIVRLVLEAGADVNSVDGCGHSVLFKAISSGNEDLVRLILDYGADVNQSIADVHVA